MTSKHFVLLVGSSLRYIADIMFSKITIVLSVNSPQERRIFGFNFAHKLTLAYHDYVG